MEAPPTPAVAILHGPAGRHAARVLANRLERAGAASAWLEEAAPPETLPGNWEGDRSAAAALLLLTPDAVPGAANRETWRAVLAHLEANAPPPMGFVLIADCPYPRLLEQRRFWRWAPDPTPALRAIEEWVFGTWETPLAERFIPARLDGFRGRERELAWLWERLVDAPGSAAAVRAPSGYGKTWLAQTFARAAAGHFEAVVWLGCAGRSGAFAAGELAAARGLCLRSDSPGELHAAMEKLAERRLLLVLDGGAPWPPPGGRVSTLYLVREADTAASVEMLQLEPAGGPEPPQLPAGQTELSLWRAASACGGNDFPLALAAAVARLPAPGAAEAILRLESLGLVEPVDEAGARFRLSTAARSLAPPEDDRRLEQTRQLLRAFANWPADPALAAACLPQFENAFDWAEKQAWDLAAEAGLRAMAFARAAGRGAEAAAIARRLKRAALPRLDRHVLERCERELAWIDGQAMPAAPEAVPRQLELGFD